MQSLSLTLELSQVSDGSQRFTRLLAQCIGKAREAIKSCVNLEVDQTYL